MKAKQFSFERLVSEHFKLIHKWIHEPHVWQWWGENKLWTYGDVCGKYDSYALNYKTEQGVKKSIYPYIIQLKGQSIGYIQFYDAFDFPREGFDPRDILNNEEKIAALDFYIGESAYLGKGLGAEVLRIFLQHLVFEQFDACLVDPEKSNQIAVKTYAKAGFALFKEDSSIAIMIARKV